MGRGVKCETNKPKTVPLLISWLIIHCNELPATHLDLIPGLAELQLAHWPDHSKYLQTR